MFRMFRCLVRDAGATFCKYNKRLSMIPVCARSLPNYRYFLKPETKYFRNKKPGGVWMIGIFSLFGFFEKKKEDTDLEILVKRGILAMREGDGRKAEQMFHVALKLAQDLENEDAITYIYDMMANLAFRNGEATKAEKLFKDVLSRVLSKGMSREDNAVVDISLKLAAVYVKTGDTAKANEGFKFCIDTQEKKMKQMESLDNDTLALWAMSIDWYSRFLIDQGKHDYAEKYFKKALEVSKTLNGPEHQQTAVLLSDLATVCSLQKRNADALKYLEQAIQIGISQNLEELGAFYVNEGLIKLQMGLLAEAKRACTLAFKKGKLHDNEEIKSEAEDCLKEVEKVIKNAAS